MWIDRNFGQRMLNVLAVILSIYVFHAESASDISLVYEGKGASVVKAAIAKLEDTEIFPDDHGFFRKIAWVESKDGTDKATYRDNFDGGIWQIDYPTFEETKTSVMAKTRIHPLLLDRLGIDWQKIGYGDLRKPLISLIAAQIHLFITTVPPMCTKPVPQLVEHQADIWRLCFQTIEDRLPRATLTYINAMKTLPK